MAIEPEGRHEHDVNAECEACARLEEAGFWRERLSMLLDKWEVELSSRSPRVLDDLKQILASRGSAIEAKAPPGAADEIASLRAQVAGLEKERARDARAMEIIARAAAKLGARDAVEAQLQAERRFLAIERDRILCALRDGTPDKFVVNPKSGMEKS
jgi:hypothetical protein